MDGLVCALIIVAGGFLAGAIILASMIGSDAWMKKQVRNHIHSCEEAARKELISEGIMKVIDGETVTNLGESE